MCRLQADEAGDHERVGLGQGIPGLAGGLQGFGGIPAASECRNARPSRAWARRPAALLAGSGAHATEPEAEAKLAADLFQKWGADFLTANAEIEYQYTSQDGSPSAENRLSVQRRVETFRKELPDTAAGLSSYGRQTWPLSTGRSGVTRALNGFPRPV